MSRRKQSQTTQEDYYFKNITEQYKYDYGYNINILTDYIKRLVMGLNFIYCISASNDYTWNHNDQTYLASGEYLGKKKPRLHHRPISIIGKLEARNSSDK